MTEGSPSEDAHRISANDPHLAVGNVNVACDTRIHDWLLGGTDNFVADRRAGRHLLEIAPGTMVATRAGREFVERATRFFAKDGMRQMIDLGCGLARRRDNVHDVAHRVDPGIRVVYVDNHPLAIAYARTALDDGSPVGVADTDLTGGADAVLDHPAVTELIDPTERIAIIATAVLRCLPTAADAAALVHGLARRLAPGSVVVVSDIVARDPQVRESVTSAMRTASRTAWELRAPTDIETCLDGLDILEPGVGDVQGWHIDNKRGLILQDTHEVLTYGGAAKVP